MNKPSPKRLIIIRGLPGSGKSTFGRLLTDEVYEADMYFMQSGKYQYDKDKIAEAHKWCQAQVKKAMFHTHAPLIAVSNTFVRRWEMDAYYDLAVIHRYEVTEITLTGRIHPNIHGVPDEVIERMRNSWER